MLIGSVVLVAEQVTIVSTGLSVPMLHKHVNTVRVVIIVMQRRPSDSLPKLTYPKSYKFVYILK